MKKTTLLLTVTIFLSGTVPYLAFTQTYAVSTAEATQLAQSIETSINAGNATLFNKSFYLPEMLKIIQQKSRKAKQPGFMQSFGRTFSLNGLGENIVTVIQDGNYRLLKVYEKDNKQHILFRMFGEGLNYHDMILFKVKDSIKIADMYVYLQNEHLSTTMANLIDDTEDPSNKNVLSNKRKTTVLKLKELRDKKDYAGVKALYEGLDPDLKKNKIFIMANVMACKEIGVDVYINALEQYAQGDPDAVNAYLLMFDVYYTNKEIIKGMEVINKLDSLINKDPLLDYFRGNFYLLDNKLEDANGVFEKVFAYDPSIGLNMQNLVLTNLALDKKDAAKAVVAAYKKVRDFNTKLIDELYQEAPELKD
jgi:tetratricopeptide (TPR) repeat protein